MTKFCDSDKALPRPVQRKTPSSGMISDFRSFCERAMMTIVCKTSAMLHAR